MEFTKMNGAGNDFIILNNISGQLVGERLPQLAKKLCHRRFSIGADGMMVVMPPQKGADFTMLFFNSDGTIGEMCGNGARCICRYAYENGLSGEVQHVLTTAGMITGWRLAEDQYRILLNTPSIMRLHEDLEVEGVHYDCAYVELGMPGIPHLSVAVENLDERSFDELRPLGAALRRHHKLKKGANVNFYEIKDGYILEKTFERGVEDFTYACGTGTGATVAALTLMGKVGGKNVKVSVPGGELHVDVTHDGNTVSELFLTGPATMVCKGIVLE